jgi:hypothetical protein
MRGRSMRGVEVDFAKHLAENEDMIAVGNARMNARGDILGPGGKVIKTRADIAAEYHSQSKQAVKHVAISKLEDEVFQTPAEAMKQISDHKKTPKRKISDGEE